MWPWSRKIQIDNPTKRLRAFNEPRDGKVYKYRVNGRRVVITGTAGPGACKVRYEDEGPEGRRFTAMNCNLVGF